MVMFVWWTGIFIAALRCMFSFFKKKPSFDESIPAPTDFSFLGVDMHSHLLPGVDDGAPDAETSLAMIRRMKEMGWHKLITTPHIQLEFYDNTAEKLTGIFDQHRRFIDDQKLGVELDIAAEYYLDNFFIPAVLPDGLLTLTGNYVLVEVSMAGWPKQLSDIIFSIQAEGYIPVLAHPERYMYEENIAVLQGWKDKGVMMAMNLLAPLGYYGGNIKALARKYMQARLYDFCGSDVHHERHLANLDRMRTEQPQLMRELAAYGFRNAELLDTV
jgi:protein-tyrosine phosphatase